MWKPATTIYYDAEDTQETRPEPSSDNGAGRDEARRDSNYACWANGMVLGHQIALRSVA